MDKAKHPHGHEDVLRTTVSAVHLAISGKSYIELQVGDGPTVALTRTAASALAATLQAAVGRLEHREGGGDDDR